MREPASRELPLVASLGLLLDQGVLAVGAARRGQLSTAQRGVLSELLAIISGVAEMKSAPLGVFQASAIQSAELERFEALEDTRPGAVEADWSTVRSQLTAVLDGDVSDDDAQGLRVTLSDLARATLARTSEMTDWRTTVGDEWPELGRNSSYAPSSPALNS